MAMLLHGLAGGLLGALFFFGPAEADVTVRSGPERVHLLELFTSEGCSSCPPAEAWFSTLRQSPRLWKDLVPVAFHVNYWDSLGWTDRLAAQAYTDRQRTYAAAWGADTVYTPGFVLNGSEWRDRDLGSIPVSSEAVGELAATFRKNGEVQVTFQPAGSFSGKWQAHAALLGFGVTSDVSGGENDGRRLVHDFVVLDFESSDLSREAPSTVLRLPAAKVKPGQTALAVWITEAGGTTPIQAAGGDL